MRFVLVDKITELQSGQSLSAVKNLSLAEEYLADHFPGFPVIPGVLMLEALVQSGAWLMREAEGFAYSTILLKEAKAVRYNAFLKPGETLVLNVTTKKRSEQHWDLVGTGTVNGTSAVNAKLTLVQFNLADRNPALAASDETRRIHDRALFAQLWSNPVSQAVP